MATERTHVQADEAQVQRRLRRAAVALSLGVAAAVAIPALAALWLVGTVRRDDAAVTGDAQWQVELERLQVDDELASRAVRSALLTDDSGALARLANARSSFDALLGSVRAEAITRSAAAVRAQLDAVTRDEQAVRTASDEALALHGDAAKAAFESAVVPRQSALDADFRALLVTARSTFSEARNGARLTALLAVAAISLSATLCLAVALFLAWSLRRTSKTAARLLDELGVKNRDLDQFAGRVAHDLRNLLSPLKLAASQLQSDDAVRRTRALERVRRALERAEALLDGLLVFTRAGHAVPGQATSVAPVVREVADALAPMAVEVDARVDVAVDDVVVACPPSLLFQVVLNLVSNALKHVRGEDRRTVRVSATATRDEVTLNVDDSGPGVPEAALASLGAAFFRVPGDLTPGTGLGLATVRRIVDAFGGSIRFANDHGLHVRVTLPRP